MNIKDIGVCDRTVDDFVDTKTSNLNRLHHTTIVSPQSDH
jgi:hypothetical protein